MLSSISKPVAAGAAIGLFMVLAASAPARAVPVAVVYDIQLAFFSPAAGVNVLQGDGSLAVVFANGTTGLHVGAGALQILSGTAMLTNNFSLFGGAIVFTGAQLDSFGTGGIGPVAGAVTALGAFNLATVGHIASGNIHCAGTACGLAGFIASNVMNLTSGPRTVNIAGNLLGFPSVGTQNFLSAMGTGGMTPQGGVFQVTVSGQEVARLIVPEPGTGLLLGLGLAGFGIGLTTWRARQRRG
jgi:hypothetical protein